MKRTLNGDVFQNYGNDLFLLFSGFQNQAVHTIVSSLMVSSNDGFLIVNKEMFSDFILLKEYEGCRDTCRPSLPGT